MELRLITLICMVLIGVHSDDHTVLYFFTGVSEPLSGLPEYYVVAYMDDKQLLRYSSDTGRLHSVAPWMSKMGPLYWEKELWIAKKFHPEFRRYVSEGMKLFNQTGGFHSAQWMVGCELRDDGSTKGYSQIGYDGKDVVYLDKERELYVPAVHEVQFITQEWNSPEIKWGVRMKAYLEIECSKQINNLLKYGKEDLERRVCPEVKVWGRPQSDGVIKLQCLVYGFHPRDVDVKWVRNGVDHIPLDEMSPILPHPDGTYQIRVSAEVPKRNGDTYSCHVDHSSLGTKTLRVKWEPNNATPMSMIIGVTAACFVMAVAAIAVGIFLYRKRQSGYVATSTSDSGSDSSNNPNPESTVPA